MKFRSEWNEWNLERGWSEWKFERGWSGWILEGGWSEWNLECEWSGWNLERGWSESYVTFVTNVTYVTNATNVRNVKQEMAIGGDASRHSCAPLQKSNNFERFFGDSTLTFLTSENTFRLPILPIRRIIFLCLPLIKIRRRQIKIRGRQIFPGCAPKSPVFKGKVTKKGGSRGSSHISIQI